jgi:hypothetical protein
MKTEKNSSVGFSEELQKENELWRKNFSICD